jgi:hypothetical protein
MVQQHSLVFSCVEPEHLPLGPQPAPPEARVNKYSQDQTGYTSSEPCGDPLLEVDLPTEQKLQAHKAQQWQDIASQHHLRCIAGATQGCGCCHVLELQQWQDIACTTTLMLHPYAACPLHEQYKVCGAELLGLYVPSWNHASLTIAAMPWPACNCDSCTALATGVSETDTLHVVYLLLLTI